MTMTVLFGHCANITSEARETCVNSEITLSAKLLHRKPLRESNPGLIQWNPDRHCALLPPIAPETGSAQLHAGSVPYPLEHSREREENSTINLPMNAGSSRGQRRQ